ncbi:ABC transporter ATP-binding protein [Alicyclobacillus kakegawensis]|uniref:ABC transporter ATP-binding protein n=1 Tax=Alicyclobacillus kakegawensis TaxID=392012 RepID=UPI0008350E5F|nr:ABC transporter ATP-binding protein [Alicyclobacillus kakegawensis]
MPSDEKTVVVQLENVGKQFGRRKALVDVSFSVSAGKIVALLGPNGAGKTTIMSILLGLRQPTSGKVRIFGLDPRHPLARRRFACMLQESRVPDTVRVREAVEMFRRLYASHLDVGWALEMAELSAKSRSRVGKLSGGERQRLYFALCLIADVDLLFLDEPTVAMDLQSRMRFWEQIQSMAQSGKTIVLTTHYLEEADALADHVIVLNHGRVVAEGSPDAIKAKVSGKRVVFSAQNLAEDLLDKIPEVIRFRKDDRDFEIWTRNPERVLAQLFAHQIEITNLEVKSTDLEEAFLTIIQGNERGKRA